MAKASQKLQSGVSGKYVYFFGGGQADGNESMKNLLGGKGANLAEMAGHPRLRLPVPPGFTITTEVCTFYDANSHAYPKMLDAQVRSALGQVEALMGKRFGDPADPLLLSIRSGARRSMPGMMETILNVGLNPETIGGLIIQTGDERFAYDAYRRLIMMYADVVMEKAAGVEPKGGKGIRKVLDEKLEAVKHARGYQIDTELTVDELKALVVDFKQTVKRVLRAVVGWCRRCIFQLERQAGGGLPSHREDPGPVGHSGQCSVDGLREHGYGQCDGCCLHP
jgi:pyruvate,orthophosphate dikinase